MQHRRNMTSLRPPSSRLRRLVACLAAAILAGCATTGPRTPYPMYQPPVEDELIRDDLAAIMVFYWLNGLTLSPDDAERLIAPSARYGQLESASFQQVARNYRRIAVPLRADPEGLRAALQRNHFPLLRYPFSAAHPPRLTSPVVWNPDNTISLVTGDWATHDIPAGDFFRNRESFRHSALRLARPAELRRSASDPETLHLLANYWLQLGYHRHARSAYRRILRENPADADAKAGLAQILFQRRQPRKAISLLENALAANPDNPRILNNLAYTMLRANHDIPLAIIYAERATLISPGNPLYLETAGSLQLAGGDPETAARLFEKAWARADRHPLSVQRTILNQLIRAWTLANRPDLARQVQDSLSRLPNQ